MGRLLLLTACACLFCMTATMQTAHAEEKDWYDQEWRTFRVYPHMERAYRFIRDGETDKAVAELETLLTSVPQEIEARTMLVNLLVQQQAHDRALVHMDALLHDNPNSLPMLWIKADVLKRQNRYTETEAVLSRIQPLATDKAERKRVALELTELFIRQEQWGRALAALEPLRERVVHDPQQAQILLQLAELYIRNNRPEQALDILQKWEQSGLETDFRVLSRRGNLLSGMERPKEAIQDLTRAMPLTADPTEQREILMSLGFLYEQLKEYTQSQQALAQAQALNPPPSEQLKLFTALGFLYARTGAYSQAQQAFSKALALNAADPALLTALGDVLYQEKRFDEAEIAFRKALALAPSDRPQLALARTLLRLNRPEEAVPLLQNLTDPALRPEAFMALGETAERAGRLREGAQWYLQAHNALKSKQPYLALQAAQLFARNNDSDAALRVLDTMKHSPVSPREQQQLCILRAELLHKKGLFAQARTQWREALRLPNLTPEQRRYMLEQQGYAAQSDKDLVAAYTSFMQALRLGEDSSGVRLQLAFTAFALRDYPAARRHFASLLDQQRHAAVHGTALMGLARTYVLTGQPGLAADCLLRARPLLNARDTGQMFEYYRELAAVYAAGHRPVEAVQAYDAAQVLRPDLPPDCAHAVVLRQAGLHERALELWQTLGTLSEPQCLDTAQWEQGRIYAALQNIPAALHHYRLAAEQRPDAELLREYGTLLRLSEQPQAALAQHTRALEQHADSAVLAERAYDNLQLKRYAAASEDMEAALDQEPLRMALYPELGYVHKRLGHNERAADFFRQAIDNEPLVPVHSTEEEGDLRRSIYKYRGEVAKLENRIDATFAWSASTGATGRMDNAAISRSASGMELAWTLPGVGFHDERLVQIIGRAMWSSPPDSLRIPTQSIQGAVGLRVKPLREHTVTLGVERLFKLGNEAEENWLFRIMGSWGSQIQPFEPDWFYWFAFAEADYFADSPSRGALTGEARAGWTWNVGQDNTLFVSPHLVVNGTHWTDKKYVSYREAGAGLLLRYEYDETKYETPRSNVEWLIQYKVGDIYNTAGQHQGKNTHALFTTLSLHF